MKFLICHHLNTNTNFLVGVLAYRLSCIFFGMFWESLSQAGCKKNSDVHHISEFEGGEGGGGVEEVKNYVYLKVSKVHLTYHFSHKICWWLSTFLHLKISQICLK